VRVAIYIRVSTEDQAKEGYSLEVQREDLEYFARREGYEIFKIYCNNVYNNRRRILRYESEEVFI
jgi:site-specific DNA recombinase